MSKICYLVPEDKLEEMLYDVRMMKALRAANVIDKELLGTMIQYMEDPTAEWIEKEKEQFYALNLYGGRD
jgi:hypothetical protein